jgi:hypothetical protein
MPVNGNVEIGGGTVNSRISNLVSSGTFTLSGNLTIQGQIVPAPGTIPTITWDLIDSVPTNFSSQTVGTNNTIGSPLAAPRYADNFLTLNAYESGQEGASHPGCMGIMTQNTGSGLNTTGSAWTQHQGTIIFAPNSGVTQTWSYLFKTPTSASTATNNYTFYIGLMSFVAGTAWPIRGWYLKYANGANWVNGAINSTYGGESNGPVSGGIFYSASWHKLDIIFPASGSNVQTNLYLYGRTDPILTGTINYSTMEAPTGQAAVGAIGGLGMIRSSSDGTSIIAAYLDRITFSAIGVRR